MTTKLPPLSNPASFARAIVERITYIEGNPRNYRFNAKDGGLNHEGEEKITTDGATFSLIPIALRVFTASLFKSPEREWLEIFFLNQSGHMSSLLFHSASVERYYDRVGKRVSYDKVSALDSLITVRPLVRKHPEHGIYYVADFFVEPLPEAAIQKADEIRAAFPAIFRKDTVCHPDQMTICQGYYAPGYEEESTEVPAPAPNSRHQKTGQHVPG